MKGRWQQLRDSYQNLDDLAEELSDENDRFRAMAQRLVGLELTVLQRLKGDDEKQLRAIIWEAHDILHPGRSR